MFGIIHVFIRLLGKNSESYFGKYSRMAQAQKIQRLVGTDGYLHSALGGEK